MPRFAAWEFGDGAEFDGRGHFAEAVPESGRAGRAGTIEMTFTPSSVHRATLVSHGVPGRDGDGFTITLGHAGSVSLCGTDRAGRPLRLSSRDGLVDAGDVLQVTLSWGLGEGGTFSVVNCSRHHLAPDEPAHAFVAAVPLRASIAVAGDRPLVFGAAAGGAAPFFHGQIHRVTLSDSRDTPAVRPPEARVLRPNFGAGRAVQPKRVQGPATPRDIPRRDRARAGAEMLVTTVDGPRPARDIASGNEVLTRDHGLQKVRWTGRRDLDWPELRDRPHLKPIVLRRGALAPGVPERDLMLAPNQSLLLPRGPEGRVDLSGIEALVSANGALPARALLGQRGVFEVEALGVSYVHLLFDTHQMVEANGVWIEAYHPGETLRRGESTARRDELMDIFPELDREHHGAKAD